MTYLLTEEDRKAVREALNWCIPDDDAVITHHGALAILDKLQRVEVAGHRVAVTTNLHDGTSVTTHQFRTDKATKFDEPLYAVKD